MPAPAADVRARTNRSAMYIVVAVIAGSVLLCVGPATVIVVCLAAIQVLGRNANSAFGTVGGSIGKTVGLLPPREQAAVDEAREFLVELKSGQADRAYNRISADKKQLTRLAAFRDEVIGWPGPLNQGFLSLTVDRPPPANPDQLNITAKVYSRDDPRLPLSTIPLEMVRENGVWKIDAWRIVVHRDAQMPR
jgi:hypothetical protein